MYSRGVSPGSHTMKKAKASNGKGKREPLTKRAFVAVTKKSVTTLPEEKSLRSGIGRIICHRELVATIPGSTAFTVRSFELNPGLPLVFPWLATQADGWEFYRFRRLSFEYIPRTATTTVGSVYFTPEYDPMDTAPSTEAEAVAAWGTVSTAPWAGTAFTLDPDSMFPTGLRKYVRNSVQATDLRTTDVGVLHVSTVGQADGANIGQLWADYEVALLVPQLHTSTLALRTTQVTAPTLALSSGLPSNIIWNGIPVETNGLRWPNASGGTTWTPPKGAYIFHIGCEFQSGVYEVVSLRVRKVIGGVESEVEAGYVQPPPSGILKTLDTTWVEILDGLTTVLFNVYTTFATPLALQMAKAFLQVTPA